jgi:hypothetical protein
MTGFVTGNNFFGYKIWNDFPRLRTSDAAKVYFSTQICESFRVYMESCTGNLQNDSTVDVSTGSAHSCGVHNSMGFWLN